jgi:hypothetical protein
MTMFNSIKMRVACAELAKVDDGFACRIAWGGWPHTSEYYRKMPAAWRFGFELAAAKLAIEARRAEPFLTAVREKRQ